MSTGTLLGAYIIFIFFFLVFSAAGIYHLLRFGYAGDLTKIIIFLYSAVSLAVIAISAVILVPRLIGSGV